MKHPIVRIDLSLEEKRLLRKLYLEKYIPSLIHHIKHDHEKAKQLPIFPFEVQTRLVTRFTLIKEQHLMDLRHKILELYRPYFREVKSTLVFTLTDQFLVLDKQLEEGASKWKPAPEDFAKTIHSDIALEYQTIIDTCKKVGWIGIVLSPPRKTTHSGKLAHLDYRMHSRIFLLKNLKAGVGIKCRRDECAADLRFTSKGKDIFSSSLDELKEVVRALSIELPPKSVKQVMIESIFTAFQDAGLLFFPPMSIETTLAKMRTVHVVVDTTTTIQEKEEEEA